jgi:La-related protein 7
LLSIATHEKEVDDKNEEKMDEKSEEVKEKVEDESDEPPTKKLKVEEDEKTEENQEESETETSKVSEKETEDEEKHEDEEGTSKKKKKNRKHKKKPKTNTLVEQHILAMKIMRKKDWKKMRNAYLNMERQKAKEIKKILRDSYNKRNNNKVQESPKFSQLNTASPKINFYNYGSPIGQDERAEVSSYEPLSESKQTGLVFTPNVIVNIKFREPCSDFKELKKEFKQFTYVNYVDMIEGGSQCYIRVETPASAQELVSQYSSCEYETEVLKDEAEKEYWKKIFDKRDSSKNSTARKPNPIKRRRGRERLLEKIQKASTHVRFEETEETVE